MKKPTNQSFSQSTNPIGQWASQQTSQPKDHIVNQETVCKLVILANIVVAKWLVLECQIFLPVNQQTIQQTTNLVIQPSNKSFSQSTNPITYTQSPKEPVRGL